MTKEELKEEADFEKAYNEAEELLDKQIEATYKLFEENKELKERNKVIDEELYFVLQVLTTLTEGMRHIAYNHPTMQAHRDIMQNLRLAEDYEVELKNILSQGNFGRDKIEVELGKNENRKPNFLYLKHDMVDAIAYAIYYTANPKSEMCVPNCAYIQAEKMFEKWKEIKENDQKD